MLTTLFAFVFTFLVLLTTMVTCKPRKRSRTKRFAFLGIFRPNPSNTLLVTVVTHFFAMFLVTTFSSAFAVLTCMFAIHPEGHMS